MNGIPQHPKENSAKQTPSLPDSDPHSNAPLKK